MGKNARLNTKAASSSLSFDHQCSHCEKVIDLFLTLESAAQNEIFSPV